jgi:hypothetical protein
MSERLSRKTKRLKILEVKHIILPQVEAVAVAMAVEVEVEVDFMVSRQIIRFNRKLIKNRKNLYFTATKIWAR